MKKFIFLLLFTLPLFAIESYKVPFFNITLKQDSDKTPFCAGDNTAFTQHIVNPFHYQSDVEKDRATAFLVGGINSNEKLQKITTLTGADFAILTHRARPFQFANKTEAVYWTGLGKSIARQSKDGFIQGNEDLRQVLMRDNQLVLMQGTNHQKVAEPLLTAISKFEADYSKTQGAVPFTYQGKNYFIEGRIMGIGRLRAISQQGSQWARLPKDTFKSGWIGDGIQGSFFNDELFANWEFRIKDAQGKELLGDALTPHLIFRYGFYQTGKYRMDPNQIIAFFK